MLNEKDEEDSDVQSIHRNADKKEDFHSILDHRNMDEAF